MAKRKPDKVMTLGLIRVGDKMLLGKKKPGYFGAGKWNGFGGKVEDKEKIEDALCREFREEVGLKVLGFEKRAILDFHNDLGAKLFQVHLFGISEFSGEPIESEEMSPEWHRVDSLPFEEMWHDDFFWMPLFLNGKKFTGSFLFDMDGRVLEYELFEVKSI